MSMYQCKECKKSWNYPVKKCIFCDGDIEEVSETQYHVIGSTQVNIPSSGNEKVPYMEYLLEDRNGNKIIKKSFDQHEIGDAIDLGEAKKSGLVVGVVGTGTLGSGIAEYLLRNGCTTIIKSRSDSHCKDVISKISKKLSKDNTAGQVDQLLSSLKAVTNFSDMAHCDLIIEAAVEDIDAKKEVFASLSKVCDAKTIFATNTSSLSIDEIAAVTGRPDKCIGMHFFNPVSKMDLIEVVIGRDTSADTLDRIISFSKDLHKKPISVHNYPGFIVNRLLLPQINEAVKLYETGVAAKEDIDAAMKLGLNHPMGPFALADLIGIDVCVLILNTLYNSLGEERYRPAATMAGLLKDGKLGFKTGEGFYKYK